MAKAEIARVSNEIADALDIQGANPCRVRVSRSAAQFIEGYSVPLARLVREGGDLDAQAYVGPDIAAHIRSRIETDAVAARSPDGRRHRGTR